MKATLKKITSLINGKKMNFCIFLVFVVVMSLFPSITYGDDNERPKVILRDTSGSNISTPSESEPDEEYSVQLSPEEETKATDFVISCVAQDMEYIGNTINSQKHSLFLNLSLEEKEMLCRIVEAEVTGVSYRGAYGNEMLLSKFRVARVVINRVLDPRFPNSVEGVIYQRGQFTPIKDGRYYRVQITDMTRQAVDMALDSYFPDDIPGALYFNGGSGHKSRKLQLILTDAVGHKFYRYK